MSSQLLRCVAAARARVLPVVGPAPAWNEPCVRFGLGALGLAACLTASAFGQDFARPDGSVPVPVDWSSKHVLFTAGFTPEQAAKMLKEPRVYASWLLHGNAPIAPGMPARKQPTAPTPEQRELKRDWAISLGAGGVAQGMYPAKYTFDVNATPSCTADFAVFPINTSTGSTRAHVIGTFSTSTQYSSGTTVSVTVTPTVGTAATVTLTASTSTNTGTDFEVFTSGTVSTNASTEATNLAAAINRNLSSTVLDQVVAVASTNTVTVYALTPGTRVVLTDSNNLNNFSWGSVAAGTNGSQANIVGLDDLYSGSGSPLCGTATSWPEFIFSYASGTGPVATSPVISLSGTKIAYVENDSNIGAILHVLTFAKGSTEYGTCTNSGSATPTCATAPVIPGSTSGSTATDFMLPLGLVAADAATGVAGAADSYSSPFYDYATDVLYVGDNNGYLYSITGAFLGTPAYAASPWPIYVEGAFGMTGLTRSSTTVTVTVASTATLVTGESVTIAGVAAGTGTCATLPSGLNGTFTITAVSSSTQFTYTSGTSGTVSGCTLTSATVTGAAADLSAPVVDVSGTGNIFVGDSAGILRNYNSSGTAEASLSITTTTTAGAIRDAPIVDSTNAVGYVVTACGGTVNSQTAPLLTQFAFTASTLTSKATAGLGYTSASATGCGSSIPMYDPTPDNSYFTKGISSSTAANNGMIYTCSTNETSSTWYTDLSGYQFTSGTMGTAYYGLGYLSGSSTAATCSPLTELYSNDASVSVSTVAVAVGTTVTVTTAANSFVSGQIVTIAGVSAGSSNTCTSTVAAAINGEHTITVTSSTQFTFTNSVSATGTAGNCTLSSATAVGPTVDYLFFSTTSPSEVITYTSTSQISSGTNSLSTTATNTTDITTGGTSGMIVDNDSTSGQAQSIYFGTQATSTSICGSTAAYCAIKLTQSGLN